MALVWIGFLAFFVVSFVVGVRLLLLWRQTRQLPELLIGTGVLGIGPVGFGALMVGSALAAKQPTLSLVLIALGSATVYVGVSEAAVGFFFSLADALDLSWTAIILAACVSGAAIAAMALSTMALTNVTLPYVIKLANEGWEEACEKSVPLSKGLNIVNGKVVYKEIIEAFDMEMA